MEWSEAKRNCKSVKSGLVIDAKDWPWSSYGFYTWSEAGLVRIDPAD
jgi:hypothetical protein